MKPKTKILSPVHPNAGLTALYRRRLVAQVEAMHRSTMKWVMAAYRANEPRIVELAHDARPSDMLQKVIKELRKRWLDGFDKGAKDLAEYFAQSASRRTDARLKEILKQAGIAVNFKMTPAERDIVGSIVHENVGLIKSIPEQYLTQVEGIVMRSVQRGHDVGGLEEQLIKQYGVTRRRAQIISIDQNTKATAVLNRTRQLELGITTAIWHHSHGGKTPRPSHVKNDGKRYDVREGWYDPDEKKFIFPGELINCRCTSQAVIPGHI